MKKSNAALLALIVFLALVLGVGGGYVINQYLQVYRTSYSEAGVSVKPADFFKKGGEGAFFTHDSEEILPNVPGEYRIRLQNGNFKFRAKLIVADTIPPQATAVMVRKAVGSAV
ncbi:MAG: hypothetical protein LBI54_02325, partial [Lachnospiraceae bacterium]|nr:hypothetical protein [Lachnospiraceae bacterium]